MNAIPRLVVLVVAALACGCSSGPEVSGHACIVFDIRNTSECGAMQSVDGLRVVEVDSGHETTTDGDGHFSVPIPAHTTSAVLRIAEGRDDRRTSLVPVDVATTEDVLTPVITTALWSTYLTALHVPDDPALATIHVSFALPGAYVATAQVDGATQLLFDQGASFVWATMPPGDRSLVLLATGVAVDTGTARLKVMSRADEILYDAPVPVAAGAITWVQVGF
jgi:hypothetical protein